jgi:glycyl-tRNA synthetase
MAEVEHFMDPENKNHPKFESVAHMKLPLFSAADQEAGKRVASCETTMGEAIAQGIIGNETMGYFLARSY